MRDHSDALADVITGSFTRRVFVNVLHGAEVVKEGLPLEAWTLRGDFDAKVKIRGTGTVVYSSVAGESLLPVGTTGVLSPFRARLELVMEITAGSGFLARVTLGTFRLTGMPGGRDYTARVGGRDVVTVSRVEVSFASLDEDVRRRGIRYAEQPPSLTSAFDELRRLTGMPVEESVDDAALPAATTWEAREGGRLDAVLKVGNILGGTAVVNSVGAWTIVPDEIGDPVGELVIGANGTVTDLGDLIDTDEVYNCVVGVFEDDNRNRIDSVAAKTTGVLAVDGLYGENTYWLKDDTVRTKDAADAATQALLDLFTGSLMYDVPIQCHVNPLVELGDVLALTGWSRDLVGRLVKFTMSDGALMNGTLRVARAL